MNRIPSAPARTPHAATHRTSHARSTMTNAAFPHVRRLVRVSAFGVLLGVVMLAGSVGCAGKARSASPSTADRIAAMEQATQLAAQSQQAFARKDWNNAISYAQQAVVLNPGFGAAWNNLGLAFMSRAQGTDYLAAQQAFQQAVSLLPADPTPARNLGVLYEQRGFASDALQYYNQALDIDENDIPSLRGLTKAGLLTHATDPLHLDRLKRAQLMETDPRWLEIIRRERLRIENELREKHSNDDDVRRPE